MWTILKDGKKSKPIATANIIDLIEAGKLSGSDLAWRDGFHDWTPLAECSEFKSKFHSEKFTIKPAGQPDEERGTPKEIGMNQPEKLSNPNQLPGNIPSRSPIPTMKHGAFQIGLYYANLVWGLSLFGFLYFWWFYDPTVSFLASNTKVNGMLGCSVLLLISSMYIIGYFLLVTLLRIERLLTDKKGA